RQRLLPGVASGELLLSGALTEPRNPDALAPITRAAPDGEAWRLNGGKLAVPAAASSAALVVSAAVHGGSARLFLVGPCPAGATLERPDLTNRDVHFLRPL